MKRFADYIQQIIRAKTISEFPAKKGFDYTVAIIQPELGSAEGIYRSLLPAMHLTAGTNIRCIPVGISEQQNSLSINQKQFEIKRALAEICNHIVFPFTSLPLADTIKNLREINPKLKFSYYVDYNYYYTPDSYPFSNEYVGAEAIAIIENNISLMNQVIVSNRELYKFLSMELSKKDFIKGKGIDICYQPFFFDKGFTADLVPPETKTKTKTRFGLVLNQYHFNDLSFIKGILKEFQKKHPEVEYVVLGWNGDYKGKNYLNQINVEYNEPVIFFDYFEKLNDLDIDCFLIPGRSNKFNETSKNFIKYAEFTRLNKPVICPDIEPYRQIIKHNDNGSLCANKEAWLHEMGTFLMDPQKYEGIKDRAFYTIVNLEISEPQNLKILMDLYEI